MKKDILVLIIDDEPDAIEFVKAVLGDMENTGFIHAENGIEGIKLAYSENPDLIILDVMMPGMDGFSVFNEIRRNENTKNIPIIMLTGVADKAGIKFFKEDIKKFYGASPVEYIEKPLDPEKLIRSVERLFEHHSH